MIHYQKNPAPRDIISPFNFDDFSGGLNNKTELNDNQARACLNISFASDRQIQKRLGIYASITEHGTSTNDITWIGEYKPYTGANQLVTFTLDKVVIGAVEFDIPNAAYGVTFLDQFFFVDGLGIWVYDGTTMRRMVNPGTYTPAPPPAVIGVWVNDDGTNPKQRWYEPCEAQLDDAELGEGIIPEKPSLIATRLGRLYISGAEDDPNNVYISDIENGFYWPVVLPLQPNPNGEIVTCLIEFMDTMVVGREESVYAIFGNTNESDGGDEIFRMKLIQTHAGMINQDSVQRMHNYLVYVGSDGIIYRMITPLTDVRYITTDVLSRDVDLLRPPINMSLAELKNSRAIFFEDEYYLSGDSLTMVYNYSELAWTPYDIAPTAIYNNAGTMLMGVAGVDQEIYTWHSVDDTDAYTDVIDGVDIAISAYWTSKRFSFDSSTYYKHFREIFAVVTTYTAFVSSIKLSFEIDLIDVTNLLEFKANVSIWGIAAFGDMFLSKDIAASVPTQIGERGRYLSFTIANDAMNEPFRLHEVAGDYILRGRRK
jgi:hypothetical protein